MSPSTHLTRRALLAGGAAAVAALAPRAAALAASTRCERRSIGLTAEERDRPYAKYMTERVTPPPSHVLDAIAAGPVDPRLIPPRRLMADDIHTPGYRAVETGYGQLPTGEVWVACHTEMPRVTPEMWDWWFAWHSRESARYKLWHPEAHAYAGLRSARSEQLPVRDQYVGTTSYVDEIIGGHLDQLAITFRPPQRFGINTRRFDGTAICATVGTALVPVDIGLLCHQVRRTPTGSEMRSRFYLNVPGTRPYDPAALACALRRGLRLPRAVVFDRGFGAALLRHCGEEMHHLAGFLPELYAEFGPTSAR